MLLSAPEGARKMSLALNVAAHAAKWSINNRFNFAVYKNQEML